MITVVWYDVERRILLWKLEGQPSPAEVLDSFDTYLELIQGTDEPYRTVLDFSEAGRMPRGVIRLFPAISAKLDQFPRRPEQMAAVTTNNLLGTFLRIFDRAYSSHITVYTSREEAIAAIINDITGIHTG